MPVRKTESRLPFGFKPSDLGQAIVADDGRCTLVSFISSPLTTDRENVYVLFVTDSALAAGTHSFQWTISETEGACDTFTTTIGELVYSPQGNGQLSLSVRLLDATDVELASLTLIQDIFSSNDAVEIIINSAANDPGPGAGDPDVARELVNDLNPYYEGIALQTPEPGEGFQQFVFQMASSGIQQRPSAKRKDNLDSVAASLNDSSIDFASVVVEGQGVCAIRLGLLAMVVPKTPGGAGLLTWTELPDQASERMSADDQLRETLAALDEDARIDLYNLVRFPKSNIAQCGRILESLRDRYFNGANFNDVLTGMSGTRAFWISRHYTEGPLLTI